MMKSVAVVSLGCDKNRIDAERMLSRLNDGGYTLTNDYDNAEIIVVNTCAFIASARKEAVETILEMAEKKKRGSCKKLVVTGCLPQKYSAELFKELPEVDVFLGVNDYDKLIAAIESDGVRAVCIDGRDRVLFDNRIVTTPRHYAYLSVADGCDNFCTFCTIPSIRGKYRSRRMEDILSEAERLIDSGVREIILVAQDVTRYGIDLYGRYALTELLKKLSELDIMWLRLMYCYPELVTDELLNEIAANDKIAKYIDVPMQHYDDGILKLMNRRSDSSQLRRVAKKTKELGIALRTTFMVGFPTETDEQFQRLCDFAKTADIENVGIFAYSTEDDTPSAKLKPRVPLKTKKRRVETLGEIHLANARERGANAVGKVLDVLYEDIDYERNMFVGRTQYNAPEIDSVVYFTADFVDVGNIYKVKITDFQDYDLIGEKV